jgi:hypothetical protein
VKDFVKYLPHPAIIAVLAFLLQFVTSKTDYLVTWICFQTWALYFLAGCNFKGGLKAAACYAIGILASIVIMEFGGTLGGLGEWAFPTAVGVVAFAAILLEKVPAVNLIPAIFIGAGAFFGWMSANGENATYPQAFGVVMGSGLFGMLFGVVTVWARTKYSETLEAQNTQEEKAKAA